MITQISNIWTTTGHLDQRYQPKYNQNYTITITITITSNFLSWKTLYVTNVIKSKQLYCE